MKGTVMPKSVLIINCDEYGTQKIDEYLKILGFNTTIAKNGQLGIAALRTQKPDVILLASDLQDTDPALFMERKNRMLDAEKIPVIVLAGTAKDIQVKSAVKKGIIDFVSMPVMLETLRKKILHHMKAADQTAENHLTAEVFIRDGIVVCELRGSLVLHELVALKYWILDTARSNQTLSKRFYIIIYNLDEPAFSQVLFDKLFDFVQFFPDLPKSNIKILASDQRIRESLKKSRIAGGFELVDNYIEGLDKLKALYLAQGDEEILVEFLVPNAALYKNAYDQHGRLVKQEGKSFSQEELQSLLKRGIKKLFYVRKAQIDKDSQISEDEDVDVVMDAIQVTGAVIPGGLKDLFMERENKRRLTMNVLVVNGSGDDLDALYGFFTMKGFTASKASSSKEALALTVKGRFDYILVDLDLDGGNGLNLVQSMKLIPSLKGTQFIITGKSVKKESVDRAIGLGIHAFLTSPFHFEKLSGMIGERTN